MTVLLAAADPAIAAEVSVRAGNLAAALAAASPGDHLILEPGIHEGPIDIDRTITLSGRPGAVVDGGRRGNVIRVSAPEVVIRDLEIRNSGHSLERMDSGVFIGKEETAPSSKTTGSSGTCSVSMSGARKTPSCATTSSPA